MARRERRPTHSWRLDLPGGPAFVDALRRIWDGGDAALPLDRRLPGAGPRGRAADGHRAVGADRPDGDEHRLAGGRPVERRRRAGRGHERLDRRRPRASCSPTTRCAASAVATSGAPRRRRRRPLAGLPAARPRRRALRGHPGAAPPAPRLTVLAGLRRRRGGRRRGAGATLRVARAPPRSPASTRACFRAIVLGGAAPPADPPAERGRDLRHDRDRQRRGVRRRAARRRRGGASTATARSTSAARCCCAPTATAPSRSTPTAGSPPATSVRWRRRRPPRRARSARRPDHHRWRERVAGAGGARPATPPGGGRRGGRRRPPTPNGGTRSWRWWCPPTPSSPPTLEDLRGAVKEVLPAYCAPRRLELVAAIPRTALGKPRRQVVDGAPKP